MPATPREGRALELADANVLSVRCHDDIAEVVTTWREEHVVLRFGGVIGVVDRSPAEVAGLLQIREGDAAAGVDRDARRSDHARVVFAFTNAWEDAPVVEITCDAAAFELTAETAPS
ncbi:hypothetical protein [Sandaracinus amylolyticus]|uniref:hypothetical protein n=1 Tax=Sandaracinus amylolyticus TaxID=927083 RepID=UPI001F3CAFAA|nr:hypothetical protein [Sandaracinus amylolyticus]UJR83213.1 Hypothetical protein I5071_52790 [Sandaracinus amylolyticus]